MRASERGAFVVVLGAAALLLNACQIIAGLDDYKIAPTGASGSGGHAPTPTCESVDRNTSPIHCGQCDHSCLGGPCEKGKCMPITLADAHGPAPVIAANEASVFWGNRGSMDELDGDLWSLNVGETSAEPKLFAEGVNPYGVFSDEKTLYWTDGMYASPSGPYTRGVMGTSIEFPNPPLALIYAQEDQHAHTIKAMKDDELLYWSMNMSGVIRRAPLVDDGKIPPMTIVTEAQRPTFAIDGKYIYFIGNSVVYRRPRNGGEAGDLFSVASTDPNAYGIAVDDRYVYWTVPIENGVIYRADKLIKEANQSAEIVATKQSFPYEIAVDDKYIYWGNRGEADCSLGGSGAVIRRLKGPGQHTDEVIQSPVTCPSNFAMDTISVYWAGSGSIFRVAK